MGEFSICVFKIIIIENEMNGREKCFLISVLREKKNWRKFRMQITQVCKMGFRFDSEGIRKDKFKEFIFTLCVQILN